MAQQYETFENIFIIIAHGGIVSNPDANIVRLTSNIKMIKPLPGMITAEDTHKYLFSAIANSNLNTAEDILANINSYYNTTAGIESYFKIYTPVTNFTDMLIEFSPSLNSLDDGNILRIQNNQYKTITDLRDIKQLKDLILKLNNLHEGKYKVKLSDIIKYLDQLMVNGRYLLVVLSCAFINDGFTVELAKRAEIRKPIIEVERELNGLNFFGGYYNKYLKYKNKYLQLKKTIRWNTTN